MVSNHIIEAKVNSKFESLALDYVQQFGWSAPQWFSMPKLVAEAAASHDERPARSAIDGVPSGQVRARLDANLSALLSQVEADSEEPLVFDDQHASVWRALLGDPNLQGLGATDRQVYATAMHEGLTVVEEAHAHTAALQALGVSIHVL